MLKQERMISVNCKVDIKHLSRVEGHGNLKIEITGGVVEEARWEVVETPRYFEPMLRGKHYRDVPFLSSRICGICSISHCLTAIRAIEKCFGVQPDMQTRKLRLLLKHMETLQSHILHIFFLAAPDYFGRNSFLALSDSRPEVVTIALRLKSIANDICEEVGGRRLHPTTPLVGGFSKLPNKTALGQFSYRLQSAVHDLMMSVSVFDTFKIPQFQRETEFVALHRKGQYPFIGGQLSSTDGVLKNEEEYLAMTNEFTAEYSTAKLSKLSRESFAVGALARFNLNHRYLHPQAGNIAEELGLAPVCHNPFMNVIAQLVECVHVVFESIRLIQELLSSPWQSAAQPVIPKAGKGISAVEVPRGILYHCLEFDPDGTVLKADCVVPTSQNHANIYHDIQQLAREYAENGGDDREIELLAAMLVRAYDPCISCSVH